MICSVAGCERQTKARGWCRLHYERWQRRGTPLAVQPTPVERLMVKVTAVDTCWVWQGATTSNGYGRFQMDGRHWMAHRAAYELLVGPIPAGLQIDHLCRNRLCVRPGHLEPVTARENTARSSSFIADHMRQTECVNGHPFSAENTYFRPGLPHRHCRTCRRSAHRRYIQRRSLINQPMEANAT